MPAVTLLQQNQTKENHSKGDPNKGLCAFFKALKQVYFMEKTFIPNSKNKSA
ncbi:hypothetical protein D881_09130 [Corynebacterium ulcerans NCTC 12077]|nr:hypothetical protein D881_09130 [Corynebacterium ulcerans NCTC 12077]